MIFIENPLRLCKIDMPGLLLLPRQPRHKIKIVVEHTGLRGLLTLLLQSREHLAGLARRSLVHAGFPDLLLEFPHIGDVLRVHIIEFFLQICHLLLDRGFAVRVLIFLLRGRVGLAGHFCDFQEFIEDLLEHFRPLSGRILRKYRVALFI